MDRRGKIMLGIAVGAVVGLLALAAPAVIGMIPTDEVVAEAPSPSTSPARIAPPTPTPTPTPEPTEPAPVETTPAPPESKCLGVAPGKDRGSISPGATGVVERSNGKGLATVYRVVSNDSYWAIVERFCLDSGDFDAANAFDGAGDIYEGDYLAILPEGTVTAAALNEAKKGGYRTHQDCDGIARIEVSEPTSSGRISVSMSGALTDTGTGEYAEGPVEKVDGKPTFYTVQPGDTYRGIGDRFCVDAITVQRFNEAGGPEHILQPGDRVQLRPTSRSIEAKG
ncbi:LysM domain-containing protein [Microbacterium aquilitoris]|uniref:LysM domain-containing protein n=1 Tax=Microbacterium aquilitoris TaxID=3067307 RepID=UPI00288EED0A|nr:LysM domain-containing protein [Microbacterium sp. KSW2-22]MDT3345870.1 LysM domain-containing protein [Microbacterium sp. KSW2-22]